MRLTQSNLMQIFAQTPNYDPSNVQPGIVHLGIGAFHRAHQAVFIDDLLRQDPDWGILGASLRSSSTADALNPQQGLYTLLTKCNEATKFRVIGSVLRIIDAATDRGPLLSAMADPQIRIVSLTVTEKGYCHIPSSGLLNREHPDIEHDLAKPQAPISAPGVIAEALFRRWTAGAGPFTVLSCDNLAENGRVAQGVVTALAQSREKAFADWVAAKVSFPSTMVDRIVPATTEAEIAETERVTGARDAWPVVTEPFRQWVIEDDFCAGRPRFEGAGALMVSDVRPFEKMKLRMLNGSHSALAYLGLLKGYETVDQAMADETLAAFVSDMMRLEVEPTLELPDKAALEGYRERLLQRFHNPALEHKLAQIAMDGSQKLRQRILEPIQVCIESGLRFDRLARVVAAWIEFVSAQKGGNFLYELNDPLAEVLRGTVRSGRAAGLDPVASLLSIPSIFDAKLAQNPNFLSALRNGWMP